MDSNLLVELYVVRIYSKNEIISGRKNSELDNNDFCSLEGLQLAGPSAGVSFLPRLYLLCARKPRPLNNF